MQYLITFFEGVLSFVSPCMLPLLPVYLSYFAGGADKKTRTLRSALCFVAGFSIVFCALGVFSGSLGALFSRHIRLVQIICGALVILFGLSYLEVIRIPFFNGGARNMKGSGAASAFVFGLVYALSLTPCIGAFLGTALMMATASGTAGQGFLLLLCYALGLGIPFLLSALLVDQLKNAFSAIKRHYRVINLVCGLFLIAIGVLMISGIFGRYLAALTFS